MSGELCPERPGDRRTVMHDIKKFLEIDFGIGRI